MSAIFLLLVVLFSLLGCAYPHRFDPLAQQQAQQRQQECYNKGGTPEDCRGK